MNRFLLSGMMCLMIATALDAAPRGRRARRRAARQTTTQSYARSSQNSTRYNTNYRYYNYARPATTVPATAAPTVEPVTTYKPIVSDPVQPAAAPAETTVAMADVVPDVAAEVAPISAVQPAVGEVVQASAIQPIPDVMPTLKSGDSLTAQQPFCASCSVIPAGQSFGSALAELNGIRASRGLPALIEDPSLSAIAHRKASIQANAGAMYHPGGSMGGARFEGVGMGPRFTTCYQDATNVTYAGAATVVGRNGQRYHCLLVR